MDRPTADQTTRRAAVHAADVAGTCTVYAFMSLELGVESPTLAPFKATRDLIHRYFGGKPLEGTAEEVDLADLDLEGRYVRRATGWGDL